MRSIKNERLIKRNARIGSWTSMAALIVLGLGMYISFTRTDLFMYSLAALLIGFVLTQIGMLMGNKFGRSPRPDEKLDTGMKGLPNEFVMYHYLTPASHLLVGPAGLWVIKPYHQSGQVSYARNRWRLAGGGFVQSYMRLFGQEGLGRMDLEIGGEIQSLRKYLLKHMEEAGLPEIHPLIVFTSDRLVLDETTQDAPIPTIKLKQLKEFFRQRARGRALSAQQVAQLTAVLDADQ